MEKEDVINYVMNTPENTNPNILGEMIDQISEGSGLPPVTTDDNGKVLTVDEGVWAAKEASGGDSLFIVDIELDGDHWTFTSTKTYSEVKNAYDSGKLIVWSIKGSFLTSVGNAPMFIKTMNFRLCDFEGDMTYPTFSPYFEVVLAEDEDTISIEAIELTWNYNDEKTILHREKVFVGG